VGLVCTLWALPAGAIGNPALQSQLLTDPVPGWTAHGTGTAAPSSQSDQVTFATLTYSPPAGSGVLLITVNNNPQYPSPKASDLANDACGAGSTTLSSGASPGLADSIALTCRSAAGVETTSVVWRKGSVLAEVRLTPSSALSSSQLQSVVTRQDAALVDTAPAAGFAATSSSSTPSWLVVAGGILLVILVAVLIYLLVKGRQDAEPSLAEDAGSFPASGAAPPPPIVPDSLDAPPAPAPAAPTPLTTPAAASDPAEPAGPTSASVPADGDLPPFGSPPAAAPLRFTGVEPGPAAGTPPPPPVGDELPPFGSPLATRPLVAASAAAESMAPADQVPGLGEDLPPFGGHAAGTPVRPAVDPSVAHAVVPSLADPAPDAEQAAVAAGEAAWHADPADPTRMVYWDGTAWTAERRWDGVAWTDVP